MIQLIDLRKSIDQKTVVDIPSLEIPAGQIQAIIGGIDSGLETLFSILTGNLPPSAGYVRLAGVDPQKERAAFSQKVGVMFREENLYQRQSALSNLLLFCRLNRLPKRRAAEVLDLIGLGDQNERIVSKLSPGQARCLSFGRAILHQPEVLLLAEPFARCDEASLSLLKRLILGQAEIGTTVVITADNPTHLKGLCSAIYQLGNGQIIATINPQEEQLSHLPFMIPCRMDEKVILIDPSDILYITVQDDRTYLHTIESRFPTQFSLTELENRLKRSGFFRAHRGFLVNLQQVKEVIPYTRDSFSLRLKDEAGTKIPLSKSAERELRDLLGY